MSLLKQKFKKDLARGGLLEEAIIKNLKGKGFTVYPNRSPSYHALKAYDLLCIKEPHRFTIEVKHDEYSLKSQNYCLELEALKHSTATLFAIGTVNPFEVYYCPLKDALEFAIKWPDKRQAGDYEDNYAAIIPKRVFIEQLKPQKL